MAICKCPKCGFENQYDDGREFIFCQECGAKVKFGPYIEENVGRAVSEKRNLNLDIDVAATRREERKENVAIDKQHSEERMNQFNKEHEFKQWLICLVVGVGLLILSMTMLMLLPLFP